MVWGIFLTLYLGTWYNSWTRDLCTADTMHHSLHTHPPQICNLPGHTSVVNMSDSVGHVRFFDMIFEVRQFLVMSDIRAHAH